MSEEEFEFIDEKEDWIEQMKKDDMLYNDFYSEEPKSIQMYYLYINSNNELVNIKKENILLSNKKISRDTLLFLLKKNNNHENKKYKVTTLIKYNIDIFPEDIYNFLKNPKEYDFIKQTQKLDDLKWQNTINLFQDMNSLYILYNEKQINPHNKMTRKKLLIRKNIKNKKTRKKI